MDKAIRGMDVKKQNWANRIIIVIIVGIFLVVTALITRNKNLLDQKIEKATATMQKEEKSFEIWTIEGDIEDVIEEVIPIYKKACPDIRFKIKVFKSDIYNDVLLNASRTNSLPDVFFSWGDQRLEDLIELDVIADITETVKNQSEYRFEDNALEGYTFNNKLYGLPVFGWNNILYCNTEIFKTYNLDLPTTYEELLEVVEVLKSRGVTPMIIGGAEPWTISLYFMELVLDSGDMSSIENLRQNPSFFRSDEFQKAAMQFKRLIDLRPWQQNFETMTSSAAIDDFIVGKGAMMLLGSWSSIEIDSVLHSLVKGKIQAIHFPRNNIDDTGIGGYADGFVLNKNTTLEEIDVQKLFVDMMKQISDRSVEGKGLGIPVYKDQSLEGTRYELLKQCHSVFTAKQYHHAYDQCLEYDFVKHYNRGLEAFVKGYISVQEFINQSVEIGKYDNK